MFSNSRKFRISVLMSDVIGLKIVYQLHWNQLSLFTAISLNFLAGWEGNN